MSQFNTSQSRGLKSPDFSVYFDGGPPFCGLKSRDLGVYFVGNINFTDDKEQLIAINLMHSAKGQLDIDGQPVLSRGRHSKKYRFTSGKHKIEAFYQPYLASLNQANFSLNMTTPRQIYSRKELQQELSQLNAEKSQLWYVGVYKNEANTDEVISLELQPSSTPIILMISTIEGRRFVVKNAQQANLQAIFFNGEEIANIEIEASPNIPIYQLFGIHSVAYIDAMSIGAGADDREKKDHTREQQAFINSIDRLFPNKTLSGISVAQNADTLIVPEILLSPHEYKSLKKQYCVAPFR